MQTMRVYATDRREHPRERSAGQDLRTGRGESVEESDGLSRGGGPRPVALLLPGQGAQFQSMAVGLYRQDRDFSDAVDEVLALWGRRGDELRADWLAERPAVPVDHISRSQPLLFAIDYALHRVLDAAGVAPSALLGHSMGEVVASVIAGVLTLEGAAELVVGSVDKVLEAPPGGMAAVSASPEELAPFLCDEVAVGGVNAPKQTVLAGSDEALGAVLAALSSQGITARRIPSTRAFHSPLLEEVLQGSVQQLARMSMRPPRVPIYSGYTADLLSGEEATSPDFWAKQPAAPVMFWPALRRLLDDGPFVLVETGPGQSLSQIARRHGSVRSGESVAIPLLPAGPRTHGTDLDKVRDALGKLRAEGHPVS